jgi:UDP-N-acetylglucosamine 2-epimerase (non-hydrolysing)
LLQIAKAYPEIQIVYPVHFNPNVRKIINEVLRSDKLSNLCLLPPLKYSSFVYLMAKSYIILTDSGGIQEEAPSLNVPVLVMRDRTERPDGTQAGTSLLVGTESQKIFKSVASLLGNQSMYTKMAKVQNPYGDGKASKRIVKILKNQLGVV